MTGQIAAEPVLYGFHRSTYVSVARLVLHAKNVRYRFHDVESEIYSAEHLERHPFGRVPVLQHGDFWLYETSAIVLYIEDTFEGPRLLPADARLRARTHEWISALNAYFYPYMIYHLVHERIVFPDLGISPDEEVIAEALPKVERALQVLETALGDREFMVCDEITLADYFFLPTLTALGFTSEGATLLHRSPRVADWLARLGARDEVVEFRAILPPRAPIEHARRWANEHRPGIRRDSENGGWLGIGG